MIDLTYSIAKQFGMHPGPRYRTQGPKSGEALRVKLVRLLREHPSDKIHVDLDGTSGFGSSFLDEAFGGLVRSEGFDATIIDRFVFKSTVDPSYILEIRESIQRAQPN